MQRGKPKNAAKARAKMEVAALEHDPDSFRPDQLVWFHKVVRKDVKFYLLYLLAFMLLIYRTDAHKDPIEMEPEAHFLRACLTTLFALVAVFTLWVDIYRGTPAEPLDRKWKLMGDGIGGHFCYLTINILVTWAIYWPLCALAEWGVYFNHSALAHKAHFALYQCTVFSSSLGTLLTLLFLKFNWFDASWRREVLPMYDSRGNKTFRRKILFTHLNQLPIAFVDCALLKHSEVLKLATMNYVQLLLLCFAYCFAYLAFTHANHRVNGGIYPYTFMDAVFKSWMSEFIFFLGLSGFCFFVCSFYHFLASDELDRFVGIFYKL